MKTFLSVILYPNLSTIMIIIGNNVPRRLCVKNRCLYLEDLNGGSIISASLLLQSPLDLLVAKRGSYLLVQLMEWFSVV